MADKHQSGSDIMRVTASSFANVRAFARQYYNAADRVQKRAGGQLPNIGIMGRGKKVQKWVRIKLRETWKRAIAAGIIRICYGING